MKTLIFLFLIISISFSLPRASSHGVHGGFTLDLIPRDSPLSPLYNPARTRLDRLKNTYVRSISRAIRLSGRTTTTSGIEAEVYGNSGEYIMQLSLGTPPVPILGIADTGSDLTWFQCEPCTDCYEQVGMPIFRPASSSTYQTLTCQSGPCLALGHNPVACGPNNNCRYKMTYGDQSYSIGDLSAESFLFGLTAVENVTFGCGHENKGRFNEKVAGIVGLGGGPLSIVNQLEDIVGGKFSYCLIPIFGENLNKTSKINFGQIAGVSGEDVVSTPLVEKEPSTYYYLTLERVSVGTNNLPYKKSFLDDTVAGTGNIVIDSGTTLTFLPGDLLSELVSSLRGAIDGQVVPDPQGYFVLCYNNLDPERIPAITFHFTDADVELPGMNTFGHVQEGVRCLTILPSNNLAIFGNLLQQNFLIGYDLVDKKVSFKRTDCSKQ